MAPRKQQSDTSPKNPFATRTASTQDIKAFTHPLRMRLWRILSDQGMATASMLARLTGESSGQTSYHLRQLEKFGFVEEVPGEGTGRERWWKPLGFSATLFPTTEEPELDPSRHVLSQFLIDEHAEHLARWRDQAQHEPDEWRQATTSTTAGTWMTDAELKRLSEALEAVVHKHVEGAWERHERAKRDGERRIRVYIDTLVLPDPPAEPR